MLGGGNLTDIMLAALGAQGDSAEHQAALAIVANSLAQQAVPCTHSYTHSLPFQEGVGL